MKYSELMKMDVRELTERGALSMAECFKIKIAIQQKLMIEELTSGNRQKIYILDTIKKADQMIGEKWVEVKRELTAEVLQEMLDYVETPEYRKLFNRRRD